MDQNKAQVLRGVGYKINPSCVLCVHAHFPHDNWGVCNLHIYNHQKHTGIRKLSIHKAGSCPNFKPGYEPLFAMQHYQEFFQFTTGGS